jgi:hypothetical protein
MGGNKMTGTPGFLTAEVREFRDTRMFAKYALGGIAGAGLVAAFSLYKQSINGQPAYLLAAGGAVVVTLVVLGVVYLMWGRPVVLRQTAEGIERICGERRQAIRFEELANFRSKWTDVIRNGVYSYTDVRFAFGNGDQGAPPIVHDSSASYDTFKYEQLQALQDDVSTIVARNMAEALDRDGRVEWTSKLAIRRDGLELTKKPGSAPEVVGFERVSQWKVDQGLFKLGVDDSRRPVFTESTSEWNFYPGLVLFCQLTDTPGRETLRREEAYAPVG